MLLNGVRSKSVRQRHIIERRGKNWYISTDNCIITVNAYSYTIITAHKKKEGVLWKRVSILKFIKIILSVVTIIFAGLGLLRILSFYISNPVMLISLATLLLLRSVEYKNSRDNNGFILTFMTALFVYIVVIYNVFIG